MSIPLEIVFRTVLIGVGGTLAMDLWAAVLRRFGIPSLDLALLGRWIGHWRTGRWHHESIARAAPVRGERLLGWAAHYTIGIGFAALAIACLGLGIASSRTPRPVFNALKSVATHTVYGVGLYTTAAITAQFR